MDTTQPDTTTTPTTDTFTSHTTSANTTSTIAPTVTYSHCTIIHIKEAHVSFSIDHPEEVIETSSGADTATQTNAASSSNSAHTTLANTTDALPLPDTVSSCFSSGPTTSTAPIPSLPISKVTPIQQDSPPDFGNIDFESDPIQSSDPSQFNLEDALGGNILFSGAAIRPQSQTSMRSTHMSSHFLSTNTEAASFHEPITGPPTPLRDEAVSTYTTAPSHPLHSSPDTSSIQVTNISTVLSSQSFSLPSSAFTVTPTSMVPSLLSRLYPPTVQPSAIQSLLTLPTPAPRSIPRLTHNLIQASLPRRTTRTRRIIRHLQPLRPKIPRPSGPRH